MKFLEPTRKPRVTYIDNSLEFGKSWEELSWNHCTSTPHISERNEIAERAARRVNERTSAVLLQSGLGNAGWADSKECYCYLRNIQYLLSDGKTPYERRFGMPFIGPVISLYLCERHIESRSVWVKSLARKILRLCIVRGRNLGSRFCGRRHWRIGRDGRIRFPRPKAQCKGSVDANERWQFKTLSRR